MTPLVRRADARPAFGARPRGAFGTGVYPRVMPQPTGEDGLSDTDASALGALRSMAIELEHRESAAAAERYLRDQIIAAKAAGRPAMFMAALEEDLLCFELKGDLEEPEG